MKYSKPELTVLGDAKALIEDPIQKLAQVPDGTDEAPPAYDLDE